MTNNNQSTMSTYTTYIFFGRTNPYLAKFGIFNGRTVIAFRTEYCTPGCAESLLRSYCVEESDNYTIDEEGNVVYCTSYNHETDEATHEVIMEAGATSYEHDGRTYWFSAIDDLTEEEARVALRDQALSDDEREQVYDLHPELNPAIAND